MREDRIETALREGPPDEPEYVPGRFRRAGAPRWWLAAAGATAVAAMVVGVVVGIGLNVIRAPNQGGPVDVPALEVELVGTWESDGVTQDQWLSRMVALGFDINDLEAFLVHNPVGDRIQHRLTFDGSEMIIWSSTDGAPFVGNTIADYRLLEDGALFFADIPPGGGLGTDCEVTASFMIAGDRLVFEPVATAGCGLDERIAQSAFFNLAGYSRASPGSSSASP
ncbi:MAG: hypothetical protein K5924_02755 [Chloroflexi bacterium]|nr:hypothetical protein [Chloroflexota bacterium]